MSKVVIVAFVVAVIIAVVGLGSFFIMSSKKAAVPAVTTQTLAIPQTPTQPPVQTPVNQIKLVVLTPVDKTIVTTPTLKVTGQTVPNADVAINEVDTKSDAAGNFSTSLSLNEGDNPIIVDAFDADGNTSQQELTVTYQIPGQ